MNCRRARQKLTEYLAGELISAERAAIGAHLEGCAHCRAEADAIGSAESALRMLAVVEVAPELSSDLRERLAAPAGRRLGLAWVGAGAAAAAAAAVCMLWLSHPAPSPQKAPFESRPIPPKVTVERPEAVAPPIKEETELVASQQPYQTPPRITHSTQGLSERASLVEVAEAPPADEPVPFMADPAPAEMPAPRYGVILLLGEPQPVLPSSSCYLEVSFPDGAKSIFDQSVERDAAGRPRAVQVSYQEVAPEAQVLHKEVEDET